VERVILPTELDDYDECFLTGSAAEVTPVASIDNQDYALGNVGAALISDYAELVRVHTLTSPTMTIGAATKQSNPWPL
jgi:branched-subunit amino acid aminotransferase/4-amino-4-deoxychorismate lyase